jgi:hypothetical protein
VCAKPPLDFFSDENNFVAMDENLPLAMNRSPAKRATVATSPFKRVFSP